MISTTKDNETTQLRTLQEALLALDDVTSLTPTQKRDGASAIRAIGRILNHPLDSIPADLTLLRYRLAEKHYLKAGISRKRWQNIRASLVSTLRMLRNNGYRVNYYLPLNPAWKQCNDSLETKRLRNGLSSSPTTAMTTTSIPLMWMMKPSATSFAIWKPIPCVPSRVGFTGTPVACGTWRLSAIRHGLTSV